MALQKVLITGGAGYVGSVMAGLFLREGLEVRAVDSLLHGGHALLGLLPQPGFTFLKGDLRDAATCREAVQDVDAIVHLAAIVGDPACKRQPDLARSTNLDGTRAVLAAAREGGVSRFLFMSTCSNYGIIAQDDTATEASALQPISLYAETKVQAERDILAAASDTFCPIAFRLSTVYGVSPRMRFDLLVNDFTAAAVRTHKLVVHGEQFWRPYIHVTDVARAALAALRAPREHVCGEVFNAGGNDHNFQKRRLVELVCEKVPGTEVERVKSDFDPRSYRVCFDKIHDQLGFTPEKTVADGVDEIERLVREGVVEDPSSALYRN